MIKRDIQERLFITFPYFCKTIELSNCLQGKELKKTMIWPGLQFTKNLTNGMLLLTFLSLSPDNGIYATVSVQREPTVKGKVPIGNMISGKTGRAKDYERRKINNATCELQQHILYIGQRFINGRIDMIVKHCHLFLRGDST